MIFIKSSINSELNIISESIEIIEEGIFKKIHNKLFGADKIKIPGNTFCGKSGLTLYVIYLMVIIIKKI